jgi:hypothetical protein
MTAPEAGGDRGGAGSAARATAALKTNANGISLSPALLIRIVVTIAATRRSFDDRCA